MLLTFKHVYMKKSMYICLCLHDKSLQFCPTLCDPMGCILPVSSVHGIFQTRIVESVAISFSRVSFPPRNQTSVSYVSCVSRWVLYYYCHLGSPCMCINTCIHTWKHYSDLKALLLYRLLLLEMEKCFVCLNEIFIKNFYWLWNIPTYGCN